jgi:anti-anti-sigma factor
MSDTQKLNEKTKDITPLTVTRRATPGAVTLVVTGEVDMATYERFCQALIDETDRSTRDALMLDLTGVTYTDARTWTLIVHARNQLTSQERAFTMSLAPGGPPARVHRLMRLNHAVPVS